MSKVVSLVEASGDNRHWSPKRALESAIDEYEEDPYDAVLIIKLRKQGGFFDFNYTLSNLKSSETITLCELVKLKMARLMGYI